VRVRRRHRKQKSRKRSALARNAAGGMVERKATRGQFVGKAFWGCRKYLKCAGIVQIS